MSSDEEQQRRRMPKALLEDFAEIRIGGKMSLNVRILLEPIGILKIILIITAMFALALTAGYSSASGSNRATCQNSSNVTHSVEVSYYYPYHSPSYTFTYNPPSIRNQLNSTCTFTSGRRTFTGSAEYFVAMSSFTFIYAILSIPFYIFFYAPSYDMARYLSIIDLIITCILVFFYFLADIAWSAGPNQLNSYFSQLLENKRNDCLAPLCLNADQAPSPSTQNTVQLSFSLLFGWVSAMILAGSIWFIYKDTIIHQERMGPIYRLPMFSKRKRGSPEESYQHQQEDVADQGKTGGDDTHGGGGGGDDSPKGDDL